MYEEQILYSVNSDILIMKNMCDNGHVWILGPRAFRVVGHRIS